MIDKLEAYCRIIESRGRIFSVCFRKKDGNVRNMVCRTGVRKYVNGNGMSYNPFSKRLIVVFDMHKYAYRMVNMKTIEQIRINGTIAKVI